MRYPLTDEIHRLMDIFEPYEDGCHLRENAPQEAVDAKKEYIRLLKIEHEKNSQIDLL